MTEPAFLFNGPKKAALTIAFAHGAGAGMDSDFMDYFADALGKRGLRVARFEFPYMAQRRTDGKKRPPDRAPVLLTTWRSVIETIGHERCVVAGKSMGARMASLIAAEFEDAKRPMRGAVYLGYPFHAPGKPMGSRELPLGTTKTKTLIVQGERDPFGPRAELETFKFARTVKVVYAPDGDHSLSPRKSSGRTEAQNWEDAVETVAAFVAEL